MKHTLYTRYPEASVQHKYFVQFKESAEIAIDSKQFVLLKFMKQAGFRDKGFIMHYINVVVSDLSC